MTLLVGPLVAFLGVFCAYFVFRTRAKTKVSLYAARRAELERRAQERRQRAMAPPPPPAPGPLQPGPGVPPPVPGPQPIPAVAPWEISPTAPRVPQAPPQAPPQTPAVAGAEDRPTWAVVDQVTGIETVMAPGVVPPAPGVATATDEASALKESPAQVLLSYAGLAAALIVVILGVALMIANSGG